MLGLSKQNRNGVLLVIAVGILLAGYAVKAKKDDDEVATNGRGPEPAPSSKTTDTTKTLKSRHYETGDCVTWTSGGGRRDTDVVDCGKPHRVQITAKVDLPGGSYPSAAQWDTITQQRCKPAAEAFLGYPIDPYGRFAATGLVPLEGGWNDGDRTVWCDISGNRPDEAPEPDLHEDVRGADQQYHYKPGDCVARPATHVPAVVPCNRPHVEEVIGQVNLSGRAGPPSEAELQVLTQPCFDRAKALLGQDPPPHWQLRFQHMTPETWKARGRIIHCFLGQVGPNGEELTVSTPAPRVVGRG